MIKFFRRIRQQLFSENKFSRYFIYAIGEIVLVMIGILLALQVNNWNENRKNDKTETNYLKNLKRDLNDQLKSIATHSKYELSFIDAASHILKNFMSGSQKKLDSSFFTHLTTLQSRKTFIVTDPTFTDLLSSGNINLLKEAVFKDKLIEYYQELERIEKVIQNNNSFLVDQQFGVMLSKIGYYYKDYTHDKVFNAHLAKVESVELTSVYDKELAKIAADLISKKENKLWLINTVNVRHIVALTNLGLMQDLKTSTEDVLEELNKITTIN